VSDDDWFERALREEAPDEDGEREGNGERESEPETGAETDGRTGADADPDPAPDDATDGAGEDPFGQDFASALADAPDPAGDDGAGASPEGAEPAAGGEFGGLGPGGTETGDAGGFGGFGGGGAGGAGGGGGGDEFGGFDADEEEFDSEIDRVKIGIEGLDEMILGGVPERSLMVAIGSAGTGKTTFGLQFLHHGLEAGESAVYITLEESRERILDTADEKGWEFSAHESAGRLAVVDLDPIEMANSLSSVSSELPRLVESFDADRLVLDSVSLLEMMYDHPSERRSEVFGFTRSLKNAGVTTMVTSEASADSDYASRYGIIEYLADAVFVLQYVRPSDFRETRLAVEIQKIRDANHSRETKPYEITGDGLSVYRQANIF
jgi:KaiC domain protein